MNKPSLLTDEEIVAACGMLSINYRKIATAQLDHDMKWFLAWGNEQCAGHGSYQYSLHRRQCFSCWQALQEAK